MLKLSFRVLPLFATIVALAMALGAYMNFSGVRGAYLDLIESRMALVAGDVSTVVEAAVSVGIAASEQVTLPDLLARQAAADDLIIAIDLLDPDGAILFSSDPERTPGVVAPTVGAAPAMVAPIVNDFGVTVARVMVLYDSARPNQAIQGFGETILADAVPISIGALVVGSIACFLVLSLLHRRAVRATTSRPGDAVTQAEDAIAAVAIGSAGQGGRP